MSGSSYADEVRALGAEVKGAARVLAKAPARQREAAIRAAARLLRGPQAEAVLLANAQDVAAARGRLPEPLPEAMIDRLLLSPARLQKMAQALDEVAALPDPVGEIVSSWRRPNGLRVSRQRIPLGVVLMIYEARPNVTTDAAALCLRSGNGCVLRGGSEAARSNAALGEVLRAALGESGLPPAAVRLCPSTDREYLAALLQQDDTIDLVIPRGGEGLIRFVSERSRIPVIKHYRGNCHVFVERSADQEMALAICENAKAQRPGVCNAAETILVDAALAGEFLPRLAARMAAAGVELRGDARARALVPTLRAATEADFYEEFLDLICAVAVVDGLDGAVAHIERYGSDHTEAIVTRDLQAAQGFVDRINSSTVVVNASTRFADGGELGLGAEIGISTTRLHAYGPMGAAELTTCKFVVLGDGQIRG